MCIEENDMTIYLTKIYLKEKEIELEEYFKELFLRLKNCYDLDVSGYYDIDVYQNHNYGYIIKMVREKIEYFDCFENQVDMRIKVHQEVPIFYEFKDIYSSLKNLDFYLFKNKIYGKITTDITTLELGKILELCDSVCYDEHDMIEKYGKKIGNID